MLTLVAIVALIISAALAPSATTAQDDPAAPGTDVTPQASGSPTDIDNQTANGTDPAATIDQPEVTPEPDPGPDDTQPPAPDPTVEIAPTIELAPAAEGTPPAGDEPVEQTPVPPAPALSYAPAAKPECKPAPDQAAEVGLGNFIDYGCTLAVQVSGRELDPAAVRLDWRVQATARDGWQVQLLPPASEPDATPRWTEPSDEPAKLRHENGLDEVTAQDAGSFAATGQLRFGVRLHRSGCGADAEPVELKVTAKAETPDLEGVAIERTSPQPEPFVLNPALAATAAPTLAFSGSLNFGEISVDAFGAQEVPAPQTIQVTVSGLDRSCGAWTLGLKTTALSSEDGSELPPIALRLVSINDEPIPDGGCALDGGCRIAVIESGPEADPTATLTLGVSLVLPDQLRAARFNSTLTATIKEESS